MITERDLKLTMSKKLKLIFYDIKENIKCKMIKLSFNFFFANIGGRLFFVLSKCSKDEVSLESYD